MQHALHGLLRAGERRTEHRSRRKKEASIDREVRPVELHQSENPWRPPSREQADTKEKNRVLLRAIRGLLNGATPSRKEALISVFLEYRVHESSALNEVISIIFDVAVESPAYCDLYAAMCGAQVGSELMKNQDRDSSRFKEEILKKVKETFNTKTISGKVDESLRKARLGHINFIGYLYMERIVPFKFMHFRVLDLLKSIDKGQVEEDLIECAVKLIENIGRKMEQEEELRTDDCSIQTIFDLLDKAKEKVSNRVRLLIINLMENRRMNWRERMEVAGNPPRKMREFVGRMKEDEKENNQMAERRQLPGRGGRGRGERGRGGWEGERRGMQPRQDDGPRPARPMQILMRRDADTPAAMPPVEPPTDTTSSTSTTTTVSSMRNQRGTLDSTGVLAMLTGAAPAPTIKQRDAGPSSTASSSASSMQQAKPEPRRMEQRRHDKTGAPLPKGQAAAAAKEVAYLGGKKVMRDASRIITESGEFSEYLVNTMMNDFLSDTNRDFRVVAAIGPQTAGKSTILSMMAGNQPLDLFRQYVFRPSSREAVEQSKHQSTKVSIYVSKARNIFIDCQPLSCVSLLDEQIHACANRERGTTRMGDRLALQAQIENLQILAWTLQVSHTVLVCHDWFIDLDIIKQLRTAELLRGATDEISALTQLPKLAPTRKTNLLFVHTRARPNDFKPANRLDRASILKRLFGGAMRVRLAELDPSKANWDGEYSLARPPLESIYFPLGEMKLREMSTAWQDERANVSGGGHPRSNAGPMSPTTRTPQQRAREKEKENNRVKDFIADLSGAVPFDEGIVDLRRVIHLMPRESFTPQGAPLLTESQWFRFACGAWRDQTFRASVSLLESTLAARRKPRAKLEINATERMRTMKISEKA